MTLQEKGTILPPPILKPTLEAISLAIQSWPGITAATHWDLYNRSKPDGADFYVGDHEVGHIHLDGEVHIPLDASLSKAVLGAALAEKFPYGKHWIFTTISTKEEAARAEWLFRLSYDRVAGAPAEELLQRVADYEPVVTSHSERSRP